jgi:GNAT superfamily N-acetyltransferase
VSYTTPRLLAHDDHLSKFNCGEPSLNEWLTKRAYFNNMMGTSRTFVTADEDRVVGYYALAAASVERRTAPGRIRRQQPDMVPVMLLARLAVDRSHQGLGLGAHLLRDAILRTLRASEDVGIRALLVHALNEEARRFYLRYDFEQSPTDELHLFLLLKDVRHLIDPI